MDSIQVMNDAMPKLMSLYVAVGVGLKSLPFKRWKSSYQTYSSQRKCSIRAVLFGDAYILYNLKDQDAEKSPDLCYWLVDRSTLGFNSSEELDGRAEGSSDEYVVGKGEP